MQYFGMRVVQFNGYLFITVGTYGLVLYHQGMSSYSVEYSPMRFHIFMGYELLLIIYVLTLPPPVAFRT